MSPIQENEESKEIALKIGRAVRALRESKGYSQEQFAELSGHHRTYIGFLERGERTPNVYTLQKVAEAIGVSLSELMKKAGL